LCSRGLIMVTMKAVLLLSLTVLNVSASQLDKGVGNDEVEDDIFKMLEDDEDYEDNLEEEADPCEGVHCPAGRECAGGVCECVKECVREYDARRSVCSNHNQTFQSDCSLYQARCWCQEGDNRCRQDRVRHAHVEYYGECRQTPDCSEDSLMDFPRRMREWLFNVMKDLADRDEISSHYKELEKEAESEQSLRWSNAAVWQWCNLDKHPEDNVVSRHELFPLKAPLHTLEHCLAPFLDTCDKDTDHLITLQEWAECLELEERELLDKCENIQNNRP